MVANDLFSPSGSTALLDQEHLFRLLVESIEDYAVYMLDTRGRVVTWNKGAELNKGYAREEVLGRPFSLFFVGEDVENGVPDRMLTQAEKTGRCVGEGWRLRKNGKLFWASFVLAAIRDSDGALIGFSKVTRDLSEKKEQNDAMQAMEVLLREERDRLRAATESSLDCLYICEAVRNSEGEIEDFLFTYLNSNVEKMAALPLNVLLGARMCEVLPINKSLGLFERYKHVVETGEPLAYEYAQEDQEFEKSWIRVQAVKLGNGLAITASDITERKQNEERILYLAHHDPLTGLLNRSLLTDRIDQGIQRAKRFGGQLGVFLMDLDGFKQLNDTLGHVLADKVLVGVAARLKATIRATDSALRFGGDEFVIVMPDFREEEAIQRCAAKILGVVADPLLIGEHSVDLSCSLGVAVFPRTGITVEQLLSHADAAMYTAKRRGKNQFEIYPG
jgi:diguanylate cyclase (GGDEF)-like protein/PAS domain S-box-containing protein